MRRQGIITDSKVKKKFKGKNFSTEITINNPVLDNLIAEGGENFFHYLNWLGLADESKMLVLSSRHHYYYDYEDLKDIKTIISLKKLNLIKHLESYLKTVCHSLSPKTNFIGCFTDSKSKTGASVTSKVYKKVINFLDSRTDIEINKKDVTLLLESNGFKVIDMTEISGLTYFLTQKDENLVK
jgi:hypothetical protein